MIKYELKFDDIMQNPELVNDIAIYISYLANRYEYGMSKEKCELWFGKENVKNFDKLFTLQNTFNEYPI